MQYVKSSVLSLIMVAPSLFCGATPVFVENNSGWALTITYKIKDEVWGVVEKQIPMPLGENFKYIANLEDITSMSLKRAGNVWGFFASPKSLDDVIQRFKARQARGEEPVIVVGATTFDWSIKGEWRKAHSIDELDELHKQLVSLQDIRSGELGKDIAEKANAILKADYTKAEKQGFTNLANRLKKNFLISLTPEERKMPTNRGKVEKPLDVARDDAITMINSLYRTFTNYKTKGYIA